MHQNPCSFLHIHILPTLHAAHSHPIVCNAADTASATVEFATGSNSDSNVLLRMVNGGDFVGDPAVSSEVWPAGLQLGPARLQPVL